MLGERHFICFFMPELRGGPSAAWLRLLRLLHIVDAAENASVEGLARKW